MLPAERRVRRREDFSATVRKGRRLGGRGLVIYLGQEAAVSPARAGFIVGRAVGPAVRRNRVRRQLRHLIGPALDALPAGTVVIVRATGAAGAMSGRELGAALSNLLGRLADHSVAPEPAVMAP